MVTSRTMLSAAPTSSAPPREKRTYSGEGLLTHLSCGAPDVCLAHLPGFLSHLSERGLRRELRNGRREMFVFGVAALLLNPAGLRRAFITMAAVQSWFLIAALLGL